MLAASKPIVTAVLLGCLLLGMLFSFTAVNKTSGVASEQALRGGAIKEESSRALVRCRSVLSKGKCECFALERCRMKTGSLDMPEHVLHSCLVFEILAILGTWKVARVAALYSCASAVDLIWLAISVVGHSKKCSTSTVLFSWRTPASASNRHVFLARSV